MAFFVKTEAPILRGRYARSSEARREDRVHKGAGRDRHTILTKKNLRCQLLHRFYTIHPQVFHMYGLASAIDPEKSRSG